MARKQQYRRIAALAMLLAVAFLGLAYRLVDLQLFRHTELTDKAEQNSKRGFLKAPRRGDIRDVRGNPLATTVEVKAVCADPVLIGTCQVQVARSLAPLLGIPQAELIRQLTPKLRVNEEGQTVTNRFVRLKSKVTKENWEEIYAAVTNLTFGVDEKKLTKNEQRFFRELRQSAIFARSDQLRVYPDGELAAHVLGYASSEEIEFGGGAINQIKGRDGIELVFDKALRGLPGWRLTETDNRKREVVLRRTQDVDAQDGLNVVLTIDSVVQNIVESALADGMEKHTPISISGIVIRPRTGEILALATLPTYNPNKPDAVDADARRNRVITDMAEPGSTFKIVTVSGALSDGLVKLTDMFDCENGKFMYGGRMLKDTHPNRNLSVEGIITHSSNIGAGKIGIKMGENRLYEYLKNFGFGERTQVPLPGEVNGWVHPVNKWSKVSIVQIPMGQGLTTTRLQMAMAMSAIANQGMLMRPMLVHRLEDRAGNVVERYSPLPVRQVVSPEAARAMTQALKTVVENDGTAAQAALDHYVVAGKTGTAIKAEHGVYVAGKYFSSFIGFFPADNPEICISVTMDEPHHGYYGGKTAAPIFKRIAEHSANYLNIRPDRAADFTNSPPAVAPGPVGLIRTAAAGSPTVNLNLKVP
jgi:cell division protein FtsI/penicillin-binding protein 2